MTERENYLLTMAGKQPEWVPNFEDACDMIIPALLGAHLMTEEKRDFFSVPWTINDAGPMVDNHQPPVMEDVTEWKKYVHFPVPPLSLHTEQQPRYSTSSSGTFLT